MQQMKPIASIIFLWIISLGLAAQIETPQEEQRVIWGQEYKLGGKTSLGHILGDDGNHFYILKFLGSGETMQTYLEKYALNTMNLIDNLLLPLLEAKGEELQVEASYLVDDFVWIFTSFYDRSVDSLYSYSYQYTLDGKPKTPRKLLEKLYVPGKKLIGEFDFELSVDSNHVLFAYTPPVNKYEFEDRSLKMIDKSNSILWNETLEISHPSEYFQVIKRVIPDSSHAYILAAAYSNRVNAANKNHVKNTGKYLLYHYNIEERSLNEAHLSLNGKYITSATMTFDEDKNLFIIGLYSRTRSYSVSGAFYLRLDMNTGKIIQKGFSDFDKDLLRQFISDKKIRNEKELDSFEIRELFLDSLDQVTLIAEQYYITTTTYTDPRTGHVIYTYYYHYNDILIVKFGEEGRIKWGKRLAKEQQSLDDKGYYSSYSAVTHEDKLYIVYNDNPKNLQIDPESPNSNIWEMNDPKKSVAVLVTYTGSEGGNRQVLFDANKAEYILNPNIIYRVDEDTIILFAQGWRDYRFVRVNM
jgi:hypothetical protein